MIVKVDNIIPMYFLGTHVPSVDVTMEYYYEAIGFDGLIVVCQNAHYAELDQRIKEIIENETILCGVSEPI